MKVEEGEQDLCISWFSSGNGLRVRFSVQALEANIGHWLE